MARMCEPRLGMVDPGQDQEPRVVDHQRQVFLALVCGRPSDEAVARGELPCGGGEAEHGERPAVSVVDGVAHLGADQGLVAEVVVAGDELVPQPALAGARARQSLISSGRTSSRVGRRREQRRLRCPGRRRSAWAGPVRHFLGGGSVIRPSRCMASMVTRAIISLRPPSGLNQPMRRQKLPRQSGVGSAGGEAAISACSSAISPVVKSRP